MRNARFAMRNREHLGIMKQPPTRRPTLLSVLFIGKYSYDTVEIVFSLSIAKINAKTISALLGGKHLSVFTKLPRDCALRIANRAFKPTQIIRFFPK